MRHFTSFAAPVLMTGLVACGLERPIEQQPLVSVVDEWRESVLATNVNMFEGEPVEVPDAEVQGDFGKLSWNEAVATEASGSQSNDMLVVEMLGGGQQQSRWGMTIVGIYRPSLDGLEPGVRTRLTSETATIIGCTGTRLYDWEFDDSAWVTDIAVEIDIEDSTLVHYDFNGEFLDGSTLAGKFTVVRE
jgi:hypothetical protein